MNPRKGFLSGKQSAHISSNSFPISSRAPAGSMLYCIFIFKSSPEGVFPGFKRGEERGIHRLPPFCVPAPGPRPDGESDPQPRGDPHPTG